MTAFENSLTRGMIAEPGGAVDHPPALRGVRATDHRLPSAARIALRLLEGLRGGALELELPSGERRVLGEGALLAQWSVKDPQVFARVLAHGDIGLGESFMDGQWTSRDPAALLGLLAANRASLQRAIQGQGWRLFGHWLAHRLRANTRLGARRNIEAHYDLGNDFYALWLDRSMSYSSALFAHPDQPLAEAQRNKYRRILERIEPRPGQTLLEIGCGWGGFAEVAATEFGVRVLGLTLSPAQLDYARHRAQVGAYADAVDFELCDYRDVRGSYDHIVSIEMFEAVGERFWPQWFRQVAQRLRPGGKALVQSITIAEPLFARYRRSTDFIQRYIFPGGMLPTAGGFASEARRAGLELRDDLAFGRDYARTLALWQRNFMAQREAVAQRGFDERFLRMWQFYLAYCEAGFRAGDLDVHQFELVRGR